MLQDLSLEAAKVGLKLHMGKTKILSSRQERHGCLAQRNVEVLGEKIEVLSASEGTIYLGRFLNFERFHDAELDNRINRGWAAFAKIRRGLSDKHYPLAHRLKLFDATVSATVLYGSGTWVMTKSREQRLRTNMRRMLRKIHGCPRKVLEDGSEEQWVDWIIRATHAVEEKMTCCNIPHWPEGQRSRRRHLEKKILESSDGRWSKRLLEWEPRGGFRRVGRPHTRWTDA